MRKLEGPDDPARKLPCMFLRALVPALVVVLLGVLTVHLVHHHRQAPEVEKPDWLASLPVEPLRLGPLELAALPVATRFDRPLGNANGALSYDAQPFGRNRHLGQDWNGIGGGDSDLGDPVYAVADGLVVYSGKPSPGWGGVLLVAHRVRTIGADDSAGEDEQLSVAAPPADILIQSFYGHMDERRVIPGQRVHRGQVIGTVGNAGGRYPAHIHFELRRGRSLLAGPGYADDPLDRIDPEPFFQAHRGADSELLTPAPGLVERMPDVLIQVLADDATTAADDQNPDITP